MEKKEVTSAIIGSTFFAIPYLALSVPILPSLLIGTSAFFAGELVFSKNKTNTIKNNKDLNKILDLAKKQNKHINNMRIQIENSTIKTYLLKIHNNTKKIIDIIEKKPKKIKNIDNFFDYYLPVTVKIIDRYDEIENQNLTSKEIKNLTNSTINMLKLASDAFEKILNNLYHYEITDMSAEMKVFTDVLKADGFDENELKIKEEE